MEEPGLRGRPDGGAPGAQRRRRPARAGRSRSSLASGRPLRVKLGLDPTAADIHLGHTVVLQKLREFQDAGHTVVLIIGDYTARVGDPSGRSAHAARCSPARRSTRTRARTWSRRPRCWPPTSGSRCASTPSGSTCRWRTCSGSCAPSPSRRSSSATTSPSAGRRASRSPCSSSCTPCCRATTRSPCAADVELGGTDQTFNLLMGRAIQSAYGQPQQSILTVPLLAGTDGVQKMSKSLGNHIGITEPPADMYGKTLSDPRRGAARVVRPAARAGRRRTVSGRATPSARSRARWWRASTAPEAAAEAEAALRPRVRRARAARRRSRRRWSTPANGDRAPAGADRDAVRRLALGGAAQAGRGRRQARRRAAGARTRSTCPPTALDGRVLQLGKRPLPAAARRLRRGRGARVLQSRAAAEDGAASGGWRLRGDALDSAARSGAESRLPREPHTEESPPEQRRGGL